MMIDLTEDEVVALMDCIGNRVDDLNDCAMLATGDPLEIEGEIENMDELMTKLGETLAASR